MKPHTILLRFRYALGDTVLLTALVRDIHLAYPGRYRLMVDSHWTPVWWHNPRIAPLDHSLTKQTVEIGYTKGIGQSKSGSGRHFLAALHKDFEEKTGMAVPVRHPRGELFLSEEESQPWVDGRYWVVVAGGKLDMTVKHWEHARYQEAVDRLAGLGVRCVQTGATHRDHVHPPLRNVLQAVGRTESARDLFGLIKHADGVLCGVTAAMHIAACFERPCVVVAGGREEPSWEAYANAYAPGAFGPACAPVATEHRFLHTVGLLGCCQSRGCWKAKTVPLGAEDQRPGRARFLCAEPLRRPGRQVVPACMDLLTVDHIVEAVMSYYESGELPVIPPVGKPSGRYSLPSPPPPEQPLVFTRPPTITERGPATTPPPAAVPAAAPGLAHPTVGGKYTVFVLCYGPHTELAQRCVGSILRSMPAGSFDLRVACNECPKATTDWLRSQPLRKLYINSSNRLKYPVMRELFRDPDCPVETKYLVWFDDDSFVVHPGWVEELSRCIAVHHHHGYRLYGAEFLHDFSRYQTTTHAPGAWFRQAPWHKGRDYHAGRDGRFTSPNGATVRFVSGGFWALASHCITDCDVPDARLVHNFGDVCIGAQVHQGGWKTKGFNRSKELVFSSGAQPRGVSQRDATKRAPWQEGGDR